MVRGILVAAAAVLVVAAVAALAVTSWGLSTVRVLSDSHTLPAAMRSLVVDTADIPVAIRISTDPDAREASASLRLVNTTSGGDHRLAVTTVGPETRLALEGRPSPTFGWARGGEITVSLPPEQARRLTVRTRQQTGVVFAHADVDQLFARTTHGAVILGGSARRMEVQTVDGAVTARDPISVRERFSATTSDGDIVVDFRDAAPRTVEAISRNGNIVLGVPDRGPYLVRAQSSDSTRVRVPETTDPAAAASELTARTDNGNIVIEESDDGWR
ncbi:hypothetical protein NIIDNTM18_37730 [Mycolicibacterium litorale]|uniref:Adhesin domain-containing protein n=1 Tax=Mycolicibacterium litorale TaxID=758802 RepID=A0A6S6P7C5_9MYCO|nr:hypothetical protein [Mycolicibacterium litorale]BCI54495.1 hypothetical protein NIIDNTM18_37730 [Mycolicibacterium litorale]